MKNINTPKFWDKLIKSGQGSLITSPIYNAKLNFVINQIKNIYGNILDIGVGFGHVEKLIRKNKLSLKMFGIDITPNSIKKIRKIYGSNFLLGSVLKIPFEDNKFDVVILLDVLEHIEKQKAGTALKEICRVLRSDGIFIISVPMNDTVKDLILNGHLRKYTKEKLIYELECVGLRIIKTKKYFAYNKFFKVKNFICGLVPFLNTKPNLLIVVAQKK